MGFKSVLRSLAQGDVAMLKPAAIEHSKDFDAIVESIHSEVLPFIKEKPSHTPTDITEANESLESPSISSSVVDTDQGINTTHKDDKDGDDTDQGINTTHKDDKDDDSMEAVFENQGEAVSKEASKMDLLEESISEAKNNKKTLLSSMESVISLMREVEHREQVAEQAKEEAIKGGLGILEKAKGIQELLQHAKEANDMHSAQVYEEKAILATGVQELQSCVCNISDEKDKSLAVLDEVREALEARLAAAEKVRKAAELKKLRKEESARKVLAEQELVMDKVVQEAKRIEQEAEENSKLWSFLMDCGHVVDSLQGEIAVICTDVKLLKENFVGRLPISEMLSSSQTSCLLASSTSSDMAPEHVESILGSPKSSGTSSPVDGTPRTSSRSTTSDMVTTGVRKAVPVDDGWEFCDDDGWEFYNDNDKLHISFLGMVQPFAEPFPPAPPHQQNSAVDLT